MNNFFSAVTMALASIIGTVALGILSVTAFPLGQAFGDSAMDAVAEAGKNAAKRRTGK